MKKYYKIFTTIFLITACLSCLKKDYEIEYQPDYPNKLAGNWVAFEFPDGEIGDIVYKPYDLVTSLDPTNQGYLIIDKLYDADIRVRAAYNDSTFFAEMEKQLETISTNTYDIDYVSVDGYVTSNPILIELAYLFASLYFENISFEESDIEDIIYMHAGFYDAYEALVDTVLIVGYRKTGFEEVEY
ncbi:hypothetical protein ES705_38244 [subsurface metagenome]